MSEPLHILSVVGARPNFMKIAPFAHAIEAYNRARGGTEPAIRHEIVHTGQHYDVRLSSTFFRELDIPEPDLDLGIGSGSHAEQVGQTMIAFERVLRRKRPRWVVVVGDVNATCACSITAGKEHIRVAHIEAGLRSFDTDMPEEINRMVTDRLSNLLLTPDAIADANLRREGADETAIVRVGNIMIDTLDKQRVRAQALDCNAIAAGHVVEDSFYGDGTTPIPDLADETFMVLTLHRPSNVDRPDVLAGLVDSFRQAPATKGPLVWPLHPRTKNCLRAFGLWEQVAATPDLVLLEPVGYHEMLRLNAGARVMLTDSGGLQEECCITGTPCVTLRHNTERPITLLENGGVSRLAGNQPEQVLSCIDKAWKQPRKESRPPMWDGHTAARAVRAILAASR